MHRFLYLSLPVMTIALIDNYSSISEHSINWSKSTDLPLYADFQNTLTIKSLHSSISKFLWKTKPPRISLKNLQKAKDHGGLELTKAWLDTEQTFCEKIQISNLLLTSPKK